MLSETAGPACSGSGLCHIEEYFGLGLTYYETFNRKQDVAPSPFTRNLRIAMGTKFTFLDCASYSPRNPTGNYCSVHPLVFPYPNWSIWSILIYIERINSNKIGIRLFITVGLSIFRKCLRHRLARVTNDIVMESVKVPHWSRCYLFYIVKFYHRGS